jgi:hypothetical protein
MPQKQPPARTALSVVPVIALSFVQVLQQLVVLVVAFTPQFEVLGVTARETTDPHVSGLLYRSRFEIFEGPPDLQIR